MIAYTECDNFRRKYALPFNAAKQKPGNLRYLENLLQLVCRCESSSVYFQDLAKIKIQKWCGK